MLGLEIKACKPPRNDLKSGQRNRNDLPRWSSGGPLALKIHFSPEVSAMEYPQCSDVRPHASTTEYDLSRDGEVRVEKNIQLIEQASRLLANISDQKMNASTQTTVTRDRVNSNPWHHSSAELSLSVGRPATGQLPPLWHHIYVN